MRKTIISIVFSWLNPFFVTQISLFVVLSTEFQYARGLPILQGEPVKLLPISPKITFGNCEENADLIPGLAEILEVAYEIIGYTEGGAIHRETAIRRL
ncbi:MAG: hypothetical protein Q4D98_03650 [Planctomycetia bacterium]|nr:hypothetical protein [Planctomycetia bacterium]